MSYTDTHHEYTARGTYISELAPRTKRRTRKTPVNYRSRSTPATLAKQAMIRELLATGLPFSVRAIGEALGISRQLALYHVKKMAADGQVVMMLQPCDRNGGLQYQVWDETALMAHYIARGQQLLARSVAA
jgi:hypothetical protein